MYYGTCDQCKVGQYQRSGDAVLCHQCGNRMAGIGTCPECGKQDRLLVASHCYQCGDKHYILLLLASNLRMIT